ncbi:MAG: 30S ribosomal protein S1, partial [Terracoccus sp.]
YKYPEGFDPETNEWLEGFDTQREKWERQYAEAHSRWEAHKAQVEAATKADAEAASSVGNSTSYSSATGDVADSGDDSEPRSSTGSSSPAPAEGTLASDEALAALREKLTGN